MTLEQIVFVCKVKNVNNNAMTTHNKPKIQIFKPCANMKILKQISTYECMFYIFEWYFTILVG